MKIGDLMYVMNENANICVVNYYGDTDMHQTMYDSSEDDYEIPKHMLEWYISSLNFKDNKVVVFCWFDNESEITEEAVDDED